MTLPTNQHGQNWSHHATQPWQLRNRCQLHQHRESFGEDTNFGTWWTTLLLLQMTKKHLHIADSERINAMNDAIETIEENTIPQSRWSLEIMTWNIRATSEQIAERKGEDALITSFESAMSWR